MVQVAVSIGVESQVFGPFLDTRGLLDAGFSSMHMYVCMYVCIPVLGSPPPPPPPRDPPPLARPGPNMPNPCDVRASPTWRLQSHQPSRRSRPKHTRSL